MSKKFKLEEFKILHGRIIKQEDRFFQLLILCITSFGVVIGFSNNFDNWLLPIALIIILLICVEGYRSQNRTHKMLLIYIIEFYENNELKFGYESFKLDFDTYESKDLPSTNTKKWLLKHRNLIFAPYLYLLLISFTALVLNLPHIISEFNCIQMGIYFIVYIGISCRVAYLLYLFKRTGLTVYKEKFKEYLKFRKKTKSKFEK